MKQVVLKKGRAVVATVPAPRLEHGTVLVEVAYSCISIGTEMSSLQGTGMPLWKRAMKQPENVKKGLESIASLGLQKTWSMVQGKLDAGAATGYSAAGRVTAVADNITDLKVGDLVACAGAQSAHHASVIRVARNLTVPVPEGLDLRQASSVTLGAIALQGVRRAQPTLGETFVVIGLGILGQLTVQLLRASGCRVIGTDLDRSRIDLATKLGMEFGVHPSDNIPFEQVRRLTDGHGADGVIITAAAQSDEIISTAFQMCRKKGRVVLVGDVGLHLNRADFYQKEIDFYISCSYGPGRYDARYEDDGMDYPISYVRWTENRNLHEFLKLMRDGRVQIDPLGHRVFPIEQADQAYEFLNSSETKPLMVFLQYPEATAETFEPLVVTPAARKSHSGQIGVALVGAGGFAKGMHLPNLQSLQREFQLVAVASRTGLNASATAKQFGAQYATTDFEQVLNDKNVQAVILATRHDLHAKMALQALQAGKHVLLEKPLAISAQELEEIKAFFADRQNAPLLLTGFNRRFSPHIQPIEAALRQRSNPIMISYRMNAGYIPLDHWVHGPQGAGRNIGEACHIYDLFTYLTGSRVRSINVESLRPKTSHYSLRDNFQASMDFDDGSVATLTYTALGSKSFPKEQMEIFCDGQTISMDDFKMTRFFGSKHRPVQTKLPSKGQLEELAVFASAIKNGSPTPIPLWQQYQATEISFAVEQLLNE